MNSSPATHRHTRWIFALVVGALVALWAYKRSTDPEPAERRRLEEAVVAESREILASYVSPGRELQLVDPLAPNRKIGKVYIWPNDRGWEVSGYYRRDETDLWHPYLMQLDERAELVSLAVKDGNPRLMGLSAQDERLSAVP